MEANMKLHLAWFILLAACGKVADAPNTTIDADLCPLTDCDGACVDTNFDHRNCGRCGGACNPGEVCSAGTCALTCQPGLLACQGGCVDPMTNTAFCGATGDCAGANAGRACVAGQSCNAGACEFPATSEVYEESFTSGTSNLAHCSRFEAFRSRLDGAFSRVTFSGSRDPAGVVCDDPAFATQLANLLKEPPVNPPGVVVMCNGNPWQVCNRGDHLEFWMGTTVACDGGNCPAVGHMARPCFPTPNGFWGGINNNTGCAGPSQTMKIQFDR
jgi:hypothetical protein